MNQLLTKGLPFSFPPSYPTPFTSYKNYPRFIISFYFSAVDCISLFNLDLTPFALAPFIANAVWFIALKVESSFAELY